jgi:hypothetical protein
MPARLGGSTLASTLSASTLANQMPARLAHYTRGRLGEYTRGRLETSTLSALNLGKQMAGGVAEMACTELQSLQARAAAHACTTSTRRRTRLDHSISP